MHQSLIRKNPRRYAGPGAMVYAYEQVLPWFSLDPNSPYRGAQGAALIARQVLGDYNADGSIRVVQYSTGNTQYAVNYLPPSPVRVEVKADSVITTYTEKLPGAGSVQLRVATATK